MPLRRVGMNSGVKPIVIFNRFRFEETEEERERRLQAFPALRQGLLKFDGYGGFDWRDAGSPDFRERTGLVCAPAWQIHTIVGCHFHCSYCNFARFANIMMNVEAYVDRLEAEMRRCPAQTLFQWDNHTDSVCFEPEYGGAKLLIDFFAQQPGKALEIYVGKSDNVDFMLDYDHQGRTVCCWSLAAQTQSTAFEARTAPMTERVEAMRKCQRAGYPVRVRFSPIIPVKNWREENREMIDLVFDRTRPDVITMEPIRFLDYDDMAECFDLSLLDEEFVETMQAARGKPHGQGCETPADFRRLIYEFTIAEVERLSPETPIAFCREERAMWDTFADTMARQGQEPDRYFCNCGPLSSPAEIAASHD
jgi:hypothetical protein